MPRPVLKNKSPKKPKKSPTELEKLVISHKLKDYLEVFNHNFQDIDGLITVLENDEENDTNLFSDLMRGRDVPTILGLRLRKKLTDKLFGSGSQRLKKLLTDVFKNYPGPVKGGEINEIAKKHKTLHTIPSYIYRFFFRLFPDPAGFGHAW